MQSLCSWVVMKKQKNPLCTPNEAASSTYKVPDIPTIQSSLVQVGDKPKSFFQSKEWIGCYEACIVLDQLYGVMLGPGIQSSLLKT